MKKDLRERLGKEWLVFDGGTGSILQSKGLKGGELPETWNLKRPEDIIDLHCGYLRAGCDIFNTNTFGANALKFPDNLEEIVTAAVENAKEARRRTGREDAYVALDIGPTGKLLEPLGDLPFEKAVELFGEVVRCGSRAGADLVLIETMSDSYEAKAAVLAAKENCDLPVCITVTFDEKGKLLTGGSVDSTVALLEGLRVDALGVNCGLGPEQMIPIVKRLNPKNSPAGWKRSRKWAFRRSEDAAARRRSTSGLRLSASESSLLRRRRARTGQWSVPSRSAWRSAPGP